MKYSVWSIVFIVILSCHTKEKSEKQITIVDGASVYEVYQPSEMSALMKGMYTYNEQLKKDIEAGKGLSGEFPEGFLNIHTAKLSETKLRNQTFEQFSVKYIEAQQQLFMDDTLVTVKERYNNAIQMCLACHKTECTGPIPKIKKLLIK